MTKQLSAYFISSHPWSFRSGEASRIEGVRIIVIGKEHRPCYVLKYADGTIDSVPVIDPADAPFRRIVAMKALRRRTATDRNGVKRKALFPIGATP